MNHDAVIRFLRDCYREDYGQSQVRDVFQRKYEHRYWHEGGERLLAQRAPLLEVPQDWAETVKSKAFLYRKEKQLIYAYLMLVGPAAGEEAERRLCAPLLWCPAEIVNHEDEWFVQVDFEALHCNDGVLSEFSDEPEPLLEQLHGLTQPPLTKDRLFEVGGLLSRHIADLNSDACLDYPALSDEKAVRRMRNRAKPGSAHRLLSAAVSCFLPKPNAARGVLTELESLSRADTMSPPLRLLLGETASAVAEASQASLPVATQTDDKRVLPISLSAGQSEILTSCDKHVMTTVIGPPGTGKSFTIAACAVDQAARGRSVLITTRMDDGVDVIAEKLAGVSGFDNGFIRFGKAEHRRAFKNTLDQIVRGLAASGDAFLEAATDLDGHWKAEVRALEAALTEACEHQVEWGALLSDTNPGMVKKVRQMWTTYRVRKKPPLWHLFEALEDAYAQQTKAARALLKARHHDRLRTAYREHRPVLKQFLSAVRAKQSGLFVQRSQDLDWSVLFSVLPIWIGRISDCHEVLPLKPAMFDVAIVDEATLCDMASLLPIAQRAKRLCIVGDPYQLRHLSFLARDRQAMLARRQGLAEEQGAHFDYRGKSAMDLAEEVGASVLLDEHFRGHPHLIAFSNRRYYNNRLRVMTEKPGSQTGPRLNLVACSQQARDPKGVNQEELESVCDRLAALFDKPERVPTSIGVLSPFRKQVDALNTMISERFSFDVLAAHRVLIGTPYSFQGQERDVMLLSTALCPGDHPAAMRYLERGGVFNVSVTRARHGQTVFCSVTRDDCPPDSVLGAYLASFSSAPDAAREPLGKTVGDLFGEEVGDALKPAGIAVQTEVDVAGVTLDMVLAKGDQWLAVDLVGYPGEYADFFTVERTKILARAGATVFPLAYCDWLFHREACIEALRRRLT